MVHVNCIIITDYYLIPLDTQFGLNIPDQQVSSNSSSSQKLPTRRPNHNISNLKKTEIGERMLHYVVVSVVIKNMKGQDKIIMPVMFSPPAIDICLIILAL